MIRKASFLFSIPLVAAGLFIIGVSAGCQKKEAPGAPAAPTASVSPEPAAKDEMANTVNGEEVTVAGFGLQFPQGWPVVDLTNKDLETALKPLEKLPRGTEMTAAAKAVAISPMIKMIAFDGAGSKKEFLNNVNLVVMEGAGNPTIDQVLQASEQQITRMGGKGTGSKVTLAGKEFGRLESHLKAPNGLPYTAFGYIYVENGKAAVVTFSCSPGQESEFDAKAQEIMKTFKLG